MKNTVALSDEQKQRVLHNLHARLTSEGDLIIHSSVSRSQQQNKDKALELLAQVVRKALYIPKRRMKTRVPKNAKEAIFRAKLQRSKLKKMRARKLSMTECGVSLIEH